jgi:hypothetical protein
VFIFKVLALNDRDSESLRDKDLHERGVHPGKSNQPKYSRAQNPGKRKREEQA